MLGWGIRSQRSLGVNHRHSQILFFLWKLRVTPGRCAVLVTWTLYLLWLDHVFFHWLHQGAIAFLRPSPQQPVMSDLPRTPACKMSSVQISFDQTEVKMKGCGMQVGDAEAVPQCAPIAPVVRLSGCRRGIEYHWMNKQLVHWHSKKNAHVMPSPHSPRCKSLTLKINGLSKVYHNVKHDLTLKTTSGFLCLCFMFNTAKYGQQLVLRGSARNWLPLAVVMLTCCVWLPLIRFIIYRCL